jgi:hypothetical protein
MLTVKGEDRVFYYHHELKRYQVYGGPLTTDDGIVVLWYDPETNSFGSTFALGYEDYFQNGVLNGALTAITDEAKIAELLLLGL